MRFFYLLAIFFAMNCYAQNQSGYYIDNTGRKVEGYFQTTDFYNENSLEFSSSLDGSYSKLDPQGIKEYGIETQFRFVKHTVKLDRSESVIRKLSANKDPQWEQVTVFLNTLVEGKATLYSLNSSYGIRFFYSLDDTTMVPEQLVYKKYKTSEITFGENNYFRQQLYNHLNCENKKIENFASLKYSKSEIVKVFKEFNSCSKSKNREYANETSKDNAFIYTFHAGVHNTRFGIKGVEHLSDKSNSVSFSAGAEIGFRIPSDKWEFFLRGEYEKLSGDLEYSYQGATNTVRSTFELDGSSFNFYAGPRYNYILSDKSKLFADAAFGLNFPTGDIKYDIHYVSQFGEYSGGTYMMDLSTTFFGNFGIGYTFNDKYGVCLRFETSRNMFSELPLSDIKTDISRIGLNFRYTL